MIRDILRLGGPGTYIFGVDVIAVGWLREIGVIGLAAESIPLGGEYTPTANFLERNPDSTNSGEEVDKAESFGSILSAT